MRKLFWWAAVVAIIIATLNGAIFLATRAIDSAQWSLAWTAVSLGLSAHVRADRSKR